MAGQKLQQATPSSLMLWTGWSVPTKEPRSTREIFLRRVGISMLPRAKPIVAVRSAYVTTLVMTPYCLNWPANFRSFSAVGVKGKGKGKGKSGF